MDNIEKTDKELNFKEMCEYRKRHVSLLESTLKDTYKENRVENLKKWLDSESDELLLAYKSNNIDHIEDECGDILMASIAFIESMKIDPYKALNRGFDKYKRRVSILKQGGTWKDAKRVHPK